MHLHQVHIKNFQEYLAGREVEATITLREGETVARGENVLAVKDSIAAKRNIAVPKDKQDHVIGIEGTITELPLPDVLEQNSRTRIVKVKKN